MSNRAYTIVDTEPAVRTGTPITYTRGVSAPGERGGRGGPTLPLLCRAPQPGREGVDESVKQRRPRGPGAAVPGNAVVPAGAADPERPIPFPDYSVDLLHCCFVGIGV